MAAGISVSLDLDEVADIIIRCYLRAQCVAGLQYSLHAPAGKSLLLQSRRTQQRTQHFLGHILIAVTRQHCTAYWHTLTWLHTGYWTLDTPPNVSNTSHLARAKVGDESGRWWVAAGAREVSSNQSPVLLSSQPADTV